LLQVVLSVNLNGYLSVNSSSCFIVMTFVNAYVLDYS
jgi:hypothetical protein